jgi:hypothetical protein
MQPIRRRNMLISFGALGGAAFLAGRVTNSMGQAQQIPEGTNEFVKPWTYLKLDPKKVGDISYRIYPQGGCMYASVGSVMIALSDIAGEPYRSFPYQMMRYGEGGVGNWGSLCGAMNGAAALIGIFHGEQAKEQREAMIQEVFTWYETALLPQYQPPQSDSMVEVKPSISGSILCHLSVGSWRKASGQKAFGPLKSERCRRLTSDGVMKVVEILNHGLDRSASLMPLRAEVQSCVTCHGQKGQGDVLAKMECTSCHSDLSQPHPKLK